MRKVLNSNTVHVSVIDHDKVFKGNVCRKLIYRLGRISSYGICGLVAIVIGFVIIIARFVGFIVIGAGFIGILVVAVTGCLIAC